VLGLKRVRVRPVGAATFIDADITVRRTLPLDRVTHIQEAFIKAVEDAFEEADVSVTTVPVALDDETVFEKVMLVSTRRGIAVHHLTVQHVGESLSVSLDIEVPADWSYWRAHDVATQLENAIANELGEDVEVETHIEPAHITGLDGHDAAADVVEDFTAQLKRLAAPQPVLSNIHDVRVRENAHGLFVTFHCWVDRNLSVDTVHDAVDELERTFREERPQVRRVIAHAEPFGAD